MACKEAMSRETFNAKTFVRSIKFQYGARAAKLLFQCRGEIEMVSVLGIRSTVSASLSSCQISRPIHEDIHVVNESQACCKCRQHYSTSRRQLLMIGVLPYEHAPTIAIGRSSFILPCITYCSSVLFLLLASTRQAHASLADSSFRGFRLPL